MKTYDELYDDLKRSADEYFEEAYDDDYHLGAYNAYRYVLDRMEEIRVDRIDALINDRDLNSEFHRVYK